MNCLDRRGADAHVDFATAGALCATMTSIGARACPELKEFLNTIRRLCEGERPD
jgi:hypothetical protein